MWKFLDDSRGVDCPILLQNEIDAHSVVYWSEDQANLAEEEMKVAMLRNWMEPEDIPKAIFPR